ncbi:MAG: sterol desaturase family protein [Desulfobulbaceae bacterium]|nr:sterol desaturase family protein [Desulfobulbaceae bacterium]
MDLLSVKPYLYWGGVAFYLLLELFFSYRTPSVSKAGRWLANLPLSMINGIVYQLIYTGPIIGLAAMVAQNNLGLLNAVVLPHWLKLAAGVLILDFFIYLWHLLTHCLPLLWRFHRVHHSDMNMDVSTANRFHLGEFLVTGMLRLALVYTFGIPWDAYILFEILVNLSVQFHHSSIRVNHAFERFWAWVLVPPYLHRIHHSVKIKERDANYGVIFSIWDRLFGTLITKVDQEQIVIGIGSHRKIEELGFWRLCLLPFTRKSL